MAHNPQGVNTITPKRDVMLSLKKKKHCECLLLQIRPIPFTELQMWKILRPERERQLCLKIKTSFRSVSIHTTIYCIGLCKKNHNRHKTMISIQKLIGKYATMSFLNTIFCHCFPNMKTWAVSQLYSCLIQLLHYTHLLDHYSKQMLSLSEWKKQHVYWRCWLDG